MSPFRVSINPTWVDEAIARGKSETTLRLRIRKPVPLTEREVIAEGHAATRDQAMSEERPIVLDMKSTNFDSPIQHEVRSAGCSCPRLSTGQLDHWSKCSGKGPLMTCIQCKTVHPMWFSVCPICGHRVKDKTKADCLTKFNNLERDFGSFPIPSIPECPSDCKSEADHPTKRIGLRKCVVSLLDNDGRRIEFTGRGKTELEACRDVLMQLEKERLENYPAGSLIALTAHMRARYLTKDPAKCEHDVVGLCDRCRALQGLTEALLDVMLPGSPGSLTRVLSQQVLGVMRSGGLIGAGSEGIVPHAQPRMINFETCGCTTLGHRCDEHKSTCEYPITVVNKIDVKELERSIATQHFRKKVLGHDSPGC